MRITKIGNIEYKEGDGEKVWLHLLLINGKPVIYATIAPDVSMAMTLAGMFGKVWETWSFQEVIDALTHADDTLTGENVDTGGIRM